MVAWSKVVAGQRRQKGRCAAKGFDRRAYGYIEGQGYVNEKGGAMFASRRWLSILLVALILQACIAGAGRQLVTGPADPDGVRGVFTLLLYGCHYADDSKNLAILVDEAGKYPFEIYDIPTSYRVMKGLPGPTALKEAEAFVRCSFRHVSRTELRRIQDAAGGALGYEVRPLYAPWEFGWIDILFVSYSLRNGVVRTSIRLDPDVERALESNGSDNRQVRD